MFFQRLAFDVVFQGLINHLVEIRQGFSDGVAIAGVLQQGLDFGFVFVNQPVKLIAQILVERIAIRFIFRFQ